MQKYKYLNFSTCRRARIFSLLNFFSTFRKFVVSLSAVLTSLSRSQLQDDNRVQLKISKCDHCILFLFAPITVTVDYYYAASWYVIVIVIVLVMLIISYSSTDRGEKSNVFLYLCAYSNI